MSRCSRKTFYPLDLDRIARDVASRGIDIAPTRLTWEMLARCCATMAGEQGRDAFHTMAAVWPDYSRHDSELCYNRALRQSARPVGPGYLKAVLKTVGIDISHACYRKAHEPIIIYNYKQQHKTMKKIPINTMLKTLLAGRSIIGRNPLTDLLQRLYPQSRVTQAVQRYHVGFNSFITGNLGDALIFWQLNEKMKIINAKRIHYRFDGHRNKKIPPIVMYPDNPQCLFGLHLLKEADPEQPVAIVESEKSALVMSMVRPDYLWMACGSLNNFNKDFLEPLRGRFIIGFPDVDIKCDKQSRVSASCALWQKTAKQLRQQGWRIIIDTTLEKSVNTAQRIEKVDVADVAIDEAVKQHVKRLKRQ